MKIIIFKITSRFCSLLNQANTGILCEYKNAEKPVKWTRDPGICRLDRRQNRDDKLSAASDALRALNRADRIKHEATTRKLSGASHERSE